MPRNKTAKHAKSQSKRNVFVTIQKMEKDLFKSPAKMAAQLNPEISSLKQKENKLKVALNKVKAQLNQSDNRVKAATAATKQKNTGAAKKQLSSLKKAHSKINKLQTATNKELNETQKTLAAILKKQGKLVALRKCLATFEKEWLKQLKQNKPVKTKAKVHEIKAKEPKVKQAKIKAPIQPIIEQPSMEKFEPSIETVQQEDISQITS